MPLFLLVCMNVASAVCMYAGIISGFPALTLLVLLMFTTSCSIELEGLDVEALAFTLILLLEFSGIFAVS